MRSLMLSAASAVAAVTVSVALSGTAHAHGNFLPRLSQQLDVVAQLNDSRPYGEIHEAIEHQVDMIRALLSQIYAQQVAPGTALAALDESLYDIMQYDRNGSDEAPYLSAQTDVTVSRMRRLLREAQFGYGGAGYGSYGSTYLSVPPAYPGRPTRYVPPPVPATPPCYR